MRHRQYYTPTLFLMLILMLLSGCSKSGKSEKEIVRDLQTNPIFISEDVEISDYNIIKRQTDVDNKTDSVYITVHTDNPELTCSLTYELKYELYNEGWILESVQRYRDGPWEFSGLSDSQLIDDIMEWDYYFSDWDLAVENFEITEETCDSNAMVYYKKRIVANMIAHNNLFDYYSTYNIYYGVVNGTWELQSVETQKRRYVPTYSPNLNATDKIMDTLEMNLFLGEGNAYDGFEFFCANEDWENCNETRYYTATKDWFYGTETFLIEIPLTFYLEDGDAHWRYNSDEITHTLQKVDWNIAGIEWACNYGNTSGWSGPLNGYAVISLKILDVLETDDSNIYDVKLTCNGYSTKYNYRCFADEDTIAKLSYTGEYWMLNIDRPDDLDDNIIWHGSFTFYGYEYIGRQGVFWNCITDGVKLQPT